MTNAFIAFISIVLLGIVIYVKVWWDGAGMSLRFTKWFFGICLVAAAVVGIGTFFAG
ncbi:hypothetical protein [Paenibacillus azoreducens]|uniref:DUF2768 domain-containing protein n=1 Tax=Paenibacillus azoreducens TaxID=116718 RepID=A0A920CSQ7_9BACL|nr:hypothetical protein [Paenibacillus azoreducens]GIO48414.1 hypothetical protein J34TS1_31790 [Paenibacillus azoreducens]